MPLQVRSELIVYGSFFSEEIVQALLTFDIQKKL